MLTTVNFDNPDHSTQFFRDGRRWSTAALDIESVDPPRDNFIAVGKRCVSTDLTKKWSISEPDELEAGTQLQFHIMAFLQSE